MNCSDMNDGTTVCLSLNDKFNDKTCGIIYNRARGFPVSLKRKKKIMIATIDKEKTGQQIRLLMMKRGLTVMDVKNALALGCVQSVYHWMDGQSLPTLDNLYALSDLLKVPLDLIVCGNRRHDPVKIVPAGLERVFCYYRMIQGGMAS